MFSNYRVCRGLAKYLATLNFDCWLVDFQGHGESNKPLRAPDFETMSLQDTEAVLAFVQQQADKPVWWVGHSGGGLAILMYLARNTDKQSQIAGVVTLASQATDAGYTIPRRAFYRLASLLISMIGVTPGRLLGLGPENEFASVMQQWIGWSLSGRWHGADGFDYLQHLADVTVPSMCLAAVADKTIAPPSGCERVYASLGGLNKTFILFGRENGHAEDYTHSRVVSSRNASVDVWPVIGRWLTDTTALSRS